MGTAHREAAGPESRALIYHGALRRTAFARICIIALASSLTTFVAASAYADETGGVMPTSQPTDDVVQPSPIDETEPFSSTPPPASEKKAAPEKPLPGPNFLRLRYDEDFSYLDGPEGSYQKDFFDPIKNIHLSDDWRLRLGGEVRFRFESDTNRNFGSRDPSQDSYLLHRYLLHADLRYRKLFRIYAEGIDARVEDRDLPQTPGMENRNDINQLFFDLRFLGEETPLALRVGRFEMSYGKERLIGMSDWANAHRRFDGAKLLYKSEKFDIDFFWTKPVAIETEAFPNPYSPRVGEGLNRKPDHFREETQFFGAYATYKGIPRHYIEAYFLGLSDKGILPNANNQRGDLTVYTIGSRVGGETAGFDYDAELTGQWGTWAGDEIHAWMAATDDGYTFKNVPMTPRLGVGFDYASGDDTPRDGDHDTFNPLYPTGHATMGYIDLVGRKNVLAPNINFSFKPIKGVTTKLTYYHFWLNSNLDALYGKSGGVSRRNVSGSSGTDVGDELDATVNWQVDPHSSFLLGWAHFWPSNFINSSGYSRDADYIFLQYQLKF